jgi:hypothetical protein
MTASFVRRLYVADLPSSNPAHWPRAPCSLTLADLLAQWLPADRAGNPSVRLRPVSL